MKGNSKQTVFVMFGLVLILCFQNCGGFGVKTASSSVATNSQTNTEPGGITTPGSAANPVELAKLSIQELQSATVKFDGAEAISFPKGLPKGALYNPVSRRLDWIPARGQSASYKIPVYHAGVDKGGFVTVDVAALSERQLQVGGPPYLYGDGEVGYIFVHGAGSVDRCADRADLVRYWGTGPEIIAPDATNRFIACYDGRKAVVDVAKDVANQILSAKCGRFNKCIIFTHSMGGLLLEHMFLHTREARAGDPEPRMYDNRDLYKAVRERTLFVVSLASAAGGSKSATVANEGGSLAQDVVGAISRYMGKNDDSTKNLQVAYASNVVAPFREDPGVPFFMVPGYSERTAEELGFFGSLFDIVINDVPRLGFNGDRSLLSLDKATSFHSRSDGLVSFRSGCGVASDNPEEGPGREASIEEHFAYCYRAPKKANHYVWFISNLNHYLITGQPYDCKVKDSGCVAFFPNEQGSTFSINHQFTFFSAVEVIRRRLADPTLRPAVYVASFDSQARNF